MNVDKIMTTTLTTVTVDQQVGDLFDLFNSAGYHHLPVVEDGKLVGIVSDRDVSQNLSHYFDKHDLAEGEDLMSRSAGDIMSTELVTVDSSTEIDCASILLLENNISCLPIVDEDFQLQGLLTWKDILQFHVYS